MKGNFKAIAIGAGIGIGVGVILVGGVLLLALPHMVPAPAAVSPSPTSATADLPSPTPLIVPMDTLQPPAPSPEPSPTPILYTVKEGDVLFNIALEYNTTVEAIKAANNLTDDIIYPGQVLIIPVGSVAAVPTPTGLPGDVIIHVVASGETLSSIAERYGVTVEAIQTYNNLTSDAIQVGQRLIIPQGDAMAGMPTAQPGDQGLVFSILEGDIDTAYPLTVETDRFTLHYQPVSLPAQEIDVVTGMVETALYHIEDTLDVNLGGRFDAYAAGSLFAPPNLALRGRSFSSQRRFFFLYDGTGTPADRQYILTHELTHLTTWNTMGNPASVMLHEGVAVYTGLKLVEEQGYMPIEMFCVAYQRIDRLPSLSGAPSFQGHIRDLDTYYAAGCFVEYLIETYGTDKFAVVYHTGDFSGTYGKGLAELEAEWVAYLEAVDYDLPFDPNALAYYLEQVAAGYDRLFADFTGTPVEMEAYRELDRARMALLEGRLDAVAAHLAVFDDLLSGT